MKIVKKILLAFLCILPLLPEFNPRGAVAGGRVKPEGNEVQRSILFTAWHRDKVIQVAIANAGDKTRALKVAVGARDVRERLFVSQRLSLPPRSVKLVYFPVPTRKGPAGEPITADHVFVFDPASSGTVDSAPVQKPGGPLSPFPDDFLAVPGDSVRLQYRIDPGNSLRVLFLPREVRVQDKILTALESGEGFPRPSGRGALSKADLPADYRSRILQMEEGNFGFLVHPGERAEIALRYRIPEIRDCALVRLSETRYEFQPNGVVRYGTGAGAAFLIYDPKTMRLDPLLELSSEEEGSSQDLPALCR
jgi:hypothetical protein